MTREGIYGFKGEYAWLSNMWGLEAPIVDSHGIEYYSSENFYVAHKTEDIETRKYIASLPPRKSKVYGRNNIKVPDYWDAQRLVVMEDALRQKFGNNEELRNRLVETHPLYIEETNTWNDTFWGVCQGKGKNILGQMLMDLRKEYITGIEF